MHHLARAIGILIAEGKVDESPTGPSGFLIGGPAHVLEVTALHLPGGCSQAWDGGMRPVNPPGGP